MEPNANNSKVAPDQKGRLSKWVCGECSSEKRGKQQSGTGDDMSVLKPCQCDECDFYHEGYCAEDMANCTAKSNDDLMTEDEYEEMMREE